ncbi:MAG TPA: hypothetical protein ENN66_06615 [Proteobacteria bacterium]|nr:hypothetical protein [Pseudomonadota bacterium]
MSTELEFEGKDISEAIEKACFAHQVNKADLKYEIIRQASKKLFGFIGGKNALIRVIKNNSSGKQLVRDIVKSTFSTSYEELTDERVKSSPPSDLLPKERKIAEKKTPVGECGELGEEVPARLFEEDTISASLSRILELMGISHNGIHGEQRDRELYLKIEGHDLELLTNKRGAVLDALQFVINKIHGLKGCRIFVDCNGFRSRHEEDIAGLALRLGEKAKRLQKPVTINSLNAHDRRLVHMALQNDLELRSRSKGEGEFKKVVIYPNGQRRRPRAKSAAAEAI